MTQTVPLATVTLPVLRAMLDQAMEKNYRDGVLGVRAQPRWDGPSQFLHRETPVHVAACGSSLAVREALLTREAGQWLVIITDREPDDLGTGILAHFVGNRARQPDEWEALRQRFKASGLDSALFDGSAPRQLAAALLAIEPESGWPPAPGGVLTVRHAMSAVARARLNLGDTELDSAAVLDWTCRADAAQRISDLRRSGGDALTDSVLAWLAALLGLAAGPVAALLHSGRVADIVPLGVAVDLLTRSEPTADQSRTAREALIRLEPTFGAEAMRIDALRAYGSEAARFLTTPGVDRTTLAARADAVLVGLRASAVAEVSDVLPSGYTARLRGLADAIRRAAAQAGDGDLDAPLISQLHAAEVETWWQAVERHEQARASRQSKALHASVRLVRWLAVPSESPATMTNLLARHINTDAWVDAAVNDAAVGLIDQEQGTAVEQLLNVVQRRRDAHDEQFARALAVLTDGDPTEPGVDYIEEVVARHVLPLAREHGNGVLFLVLDGMTAAAATEIVGDALASGWRHAVPSDSGAPVAALAALPTLTEVSRTSLLSGRLITGAQLDEQRGFAALAAAHRVPDPVLFHKKPLDSSRLGLQVADDVGRAIDAVTQHPLIACVLNTIDDSLDRSDPGGTDWTVQDIKHLQPLLERARAAGRAVVITADHGHIVERRQGIQRPHSDISSGRSRADDGVLDAGEIRFNGRRVLLHGGSAVLAVDERLRYGPLKAGYHGGASPAEAIVPVIFLLPAEARPPRLADAPPAAPAWWESFPAAVSSAPQPPVPALVPNPEPQQQLFPLSVEPAMASNVSVTSEPTSALVDALLGSAVYTAQLRLAGRASPTKDRVRALLLALSLAPGTRLPESAVAAALGVGQPSVRGAIAAMQRLLNVEGYPVLDIDVDGATLVLDMPLLREQFGLPA
jgi:hypothetical protein